MINLIRYELKGYAKDFIITFGIIFILNILLYTRIGVWEEPSIGVASYMISFAVMIGVFIWNITLFTRDMYNDSGYLLFTLPETGYSILGSKILTSLIQNIIVGVVAVFFNFIVFTRILPNWKEILSKTLGVLNPGLVLFAIMSSIIYFLYFLTTIYFSISLSKVAIRNKKFGKLSAFIIFVVLSIVVGELTSTIMKVFPEDFTINIISAKSQLLMQSMHGIEINIASIIFNAILFVVLFLATSFILENKIDL
jgi:hypothetical protein